MAGTIAVIDYGVNNLASVYNAFTHLGHPVRLVDRPSGLSNATGVVLPGVGSFDRALDALHRRDFVRTLGAMIDAEVPLLGICLGMQLLCATSAESHRGAEGLGMFHGELHRFGRGMKVPHMGWNRVQTMGHEALFVGLPADPYFYFVHSYYFDANADPGAVVGTCRYGETKFAAILARGNVLGTQFHPEKSGVVGLRFLDNYARGILAGEGTGGLI